MMGVIKVPATNTDVIVTIMTIMMIMIMIVIEIIMIIIVSVIICTILFVSTSLFNFSQNDLKDS